MSLSDALPILAAYAGARRHLAIRSRDALLARQDRLLTRLRGTMRQSPFYAPHADRPLDDWPVIDKAQWMAAFDRINTAGIARDTALALAEQAERDRDFAPMIKGITVGLSTGTSGRRGVFLVSANERRRWAGVMLAALLRGNPLRPRRVAFLLRANSNLYGTAGFGPVRFRYFDMLRPWADLTQDLRAFDPQVLIAPASVLDLLTQSGGLAPAQVVSVAETLHEDEAARIEASFGPRPEQVYQATEGTLALPCRLGHLHLNEAYLRIEPDWIDRDTLRFAPIVTDLHRHTQPVIRYRLDDIVTLDPAPCACGAASHVVTRIEGRCDDICHFLTATGAEIPVFPDLLTRAVLSTAPDMTAFQLRQSAPGVLHLALPPGTQAPDLGPALAALAHRLGALPPKLTAGPDLAPAVKRRRVVRI